MTSHFSFLRGASSCEELFAQAAVLGIEALPIVDRNTLAGIVRAHEAAKTTGVRLIVGCRLDLADGMSVLVYPTDRPAYARLCRLLSLGKKRGGKAKCSLDWTDLVAYGEGLIAVLVPDEADETCALRLRRLREAFGDRAYMALTLRRRPNDQLRLHELSNLAAQTRVPTVVTNDVLFHDPSRRILQDVVTCIRHNCTIDDAGFRRERHADRYLKPPEEMARLFSRYPEALARTIEIADRCRFSLDELAYQYPEERTMPGLTPQQALEKLTWEGAAERYPEGVPDKVMAILKHELRLIETLRIRAVLPDGEFDRPLRPQPGHSVPGPRLGRQHRRLLRARHHLDRSRAQRSSVRALRLRGAARAARHRCRFRARAARDRHAVGVRDLWPRPCRAVLDRHPLSHQRARCAMSARRSACPRT